jgi:hypothetical protein
MAGVLSTVHLRYVFWLKLIPKRNQEMQLKQVYDGFIFSAVVRKSSTEMFVKTIVTSSVKGAALTRQDAAVTNFDNFDNFSVGIVQPSNSWVSPKPMALTLFLFFSP